MENENRDESHSAPSFFYDDGMSYYYHDRKEECHKLMSAMKEARLRGRLHEDPSYDMGFLKRCCVTLDYPKVIGDKEIERINQGLSQWGYRVDQVTEMSDKKKDYGITFEEDPRLKTQSSPGITPLLAIGGTIAATVSWLLRL